MPKDGRAENFTSAPGGQASSRYATGAAAND